MEVYDLEQSARSNLGDISTRGFVGAGNNVMIGGTILTGSDATRVLFRAIGLTLSSVGATNALANPQLGLFDSHGAQIAFKDDWANRPAGSARDRYRPDER